MTAGARHETVWAIINSDTGGIVTVYETRREAQDSIDWYRITFGGSAKLRIEEIEAEDDSGVRS